MKSALKKILNAVIRHKGTLIGILAVSPIVLFVPEISLPKIIGESRYAVLLTINFYLSMSLCVFLLKIYETWQGEKKLKHIVRSPFHFIRGFNLTDNQDYWDKYQMPLRHLVGAEVGVFRGNHAEQIMNGYLNIEKLVLVDPWVPYLDEAALADAYSTQKDYFDDMFIEVKNKFVVNPKITIIRDYSVNAASAFVDEYFDFVYLDGNHGYKFVLNDLEVWYPKLKQFGVMCGDDYGSPSGVGVVKAVTEFAHKYGLLVSSSVEDKQFWFVKT